MGAIVRHRIGGTVQSLERLPRAPLKEKDLGDAQMGLSERRIQTNSFFIARQRFAEQGVAARRVRTAGGGQSLVFIEKEIAQPAIAARLVGKVLYDRLIERPAVSPDSLLAKRLNCERRENDHDDRGPPGTATSPAGRQEHQRRDHRQVDKPVGDQRDHEAHRAERRGEQQREARHADPYGRPSSPHRPDEEADRRGRADQAEQVVWNGEGDLIGTGKRDHRTEPNGNDEPAQIKADILAEDQQCRPRAAAAGGLGKAAGMSL